MEATQPLFPNISEFYRPINGSANSKSFIADNEHGISVDSKQKSEIRRRLQELKAQNEVLKNILEKRKNEIDEIIAANKKYVSVLAHDLKSPFSTIYGVLGILKECIHDKKFDDMEEFIDIASSSSINTANLIDNILVWAQSQTNGRRYNPIKINLATLVGQEINNNFLASRLKKISLSHSIPLTWNVSADLQMTQSIIRNLITNAIKCTNAGGTIVISARENTPFFEITVKDNGIGISAADQLVLFQKGHQDFIAENGNANNNVNGHVKGKGLGLVICREFVQIHGGTLRVESQLGKGSSFIFSLPEFRN